jgi:leader peptidase (prepilin peptidase)/N-methyltransferase
MVLALLLAVVGGLAVGPLLAHAVLRWIGWRVVLPQLSGTVAPRAELGRPRARCAACGAVLARPVLPLPTHGWLALGGRCPEPACRRPVARWVLAVELATAVLWGLAGLRIGWSIDLLPVLVLFAGLVAASAVDLTCWRIPSRFVYLTGAGVVVTMVVAALVDGHPAALGGAALGAGLYLLFLGSMWLISPRLLGFGDVRLGVLIGLVVGWVGWSEAEPVLDPLGAVVQALLAAGVLGSLVGLVLLVVRRRNQPFPFGPWLSLGGVLAILLAAR